MATITVARPYDPGMIQPIVLTGENVGVFMQQDWAFFRIKHVEGIPPSRQTTQDLGAVTSGSSSAVTQLTNFRAQAGNLLHLRFLPLDDIEFDFFSGQSTGGRHTLFSTKARVSPATGNLDRYWSTTTLFTITNERSIYAQAVNTTGYNMAQARIKAFGYRYVLDPFPAETTAAMRRYLAGADLDAKQNELIKGVRVTLVPSESME